MGEAPRGPSVPNPGGGGAEAAVVDTSKHERGKFVRHRHRRTSSLPSNIMPSTSASGSDEEEGSCVDDATHNSVITSTTVTTMKGADSTSDGSGDDDETDGKASSEGALAGSRKGKISFSGRGPNSNSSSMANLHGGSLRNSKVHDQQQRSHPRKKRRSKGQHKAARFGIEERHSADEGKRKKNEHTISWSRKSLHRARRAKEYSTSESEDEVPDAKPLDIRQHHHPTAMKSSLENKSMIKVVSDSKKLPGHATSHGRQQDDGNSSTDSEASTTTTYDSDDEEEEGNEHGVKRRRMHSRKPSLHKSPSQVRSPGVKIGDEDGSIPASSRRYTYRSDVESHDGDHEHEVSEEDQDEDTDDDRDILKMKRNHGNSVSFSEAGSRKFWSIAKTKIFYSFRARGNDSDDEGSKAISARNLAPAMNEQILQEFFEGCGAVTRVNISRDEFGRCSGSAYVEFDSGGAARKALQKTGTKLLEQVVFCAVAHESTTSRNVESKTKPSPAPPRAATGGGIDLQSLWKTFLRADNAEGSVRSRPKKSKSSESLHFPRGLISPGDTITASIGNERSVHDLNANGESIGRGRSKKTIFGLSVSSGSASHSFGGSHSRVQTTHSRELEQSKSQSPEIEVKSESIHVQPRGIEVQMRAVVTGSSHGVVPHTSPIPGIAFQEDPNEGLGPPSKGHNSKRKKWSFRKWRRKHRWVKMSWLKWFKRPRWHWWHFANLSARWGKASTQPSVKIAPPPLEAEPPEGYPRVSLPTSSKQSSRERSA